jgi:hypothetical protein
VGFLQISDSVRSLTVNEVDIVRFLWVYVGGGVRPFMDGLTVSGTAVQHNIHQEFEVTSL